MEFSSEAGRSTLLPNAEGNSSVHTCTHTFLHRCTHKNSQQNHAHLYAFTCTCSVSLSSPFFLTQWFPAHTVYLSWYIQSMNTQSQQVWTQLLNIQLLLSLSLVFSHL